MSRASAVDGQNLASNPRAPEISLVQNVSKPSTAPAQLEMLRESLLELRGRKTADINISNEAELSNLASEQKLELVLAALRAHVEPGSERPFFKDIQVLANISGRGESGWTNSTHIVLLQRENAEPTLAVLKVAGGDVGSISGFNMAEGSFNNLCQRLKEGRPELPRLYAATSNSASGATESVLYEFIPGPNLEAALMQGLVSWETGFDLIADHLKRFRQAGLAIWDRNADNFIVSGYRIDLESVTSGSPREWRWLRDPGHEFELTLVDTDSLVDAEMLGAEVANCDIAADENLLAGAKSCPDVESAIADGTLRPEDFSALVREYTDYLKAKHIYPAGLDVNRFEFKLVPTADNRGQILRGGSVTSAEIMTEPRLSFDQIESSLLDHLYGLVSAA